jgi:hypothetical protein
MNAQNCFSTRDYIHLKVDENKHHTWQDSTVVVINIIFILTSSHNDVLVVRSAVVSHNDAIEGEVVCPPCIRF